MEHVKTHDNLSINFIANMFRSPSGFFVKIFKIYLKQTSLKMIPTDRKIFEIKLIERLSCV